MDSTMISAGGRPDRVAERGPGRTILHVDMDAFYASIEVLRDPTLKGKPVIVGGNGPRGVVASCSYEARAFGVRSAMASVHAKRLCPQAVFVHGNHALYGEYSGRIHEVFRSFTPLVEGIALDEAFLDVTSAQRLFGSPGEIAVAVRVQIRVATELSCGVGVARNKLLAKLASKEAKPPIKGARQREVHGIDRLDGVAIVRDGEELAFLHPLPARALWGVGPKTFERLQRFGVATVGDLAKLPASTLIGALGEASGRHLHELANGIDDRPVEAERPLKSVGHEETYSKDFFTVEPIELELLRMSDAVAQRSRRAGVRGRTVQVKLKLTDFRQITRSKTLAVAVDSHTAIHRVAVALLRAPDVVDLVGRVGVRLVGVSLAGLEQRGASGSDADGVVADTDTEVQQLDLFADPAPPVAPVGRVASEPVPARADDRLTDAMDAIRSRFGDTAVGPASLRAARSDRPEVGSQQWGPAAPSE